MCKRWRDLIDGAVSPGFAIHAASHLGGTPTRPPIYPGHLEFQVAAANLLARRAQCLEQLRLDFDAYGCVFAARLLEQQPLPRLRRVALQNAEAQHVGLLRALPRLEDVCLSRQINGIGAFWGEVAG